MGVAPAIDDGTPRASAGLARGLSEEVKAKKVGAAQLQAAEQARVAAQKKAANEAAAKARAEAETKAKAAAEKAQQDQLAKTDPKGLAAQLVSARGWGADQYVCLEKLWTRESSWQWNADNPTSSAYGIPQALPGKKMASAGADWETNPATQIKWGLGYISETYGSPCQAWAHSEAVNWY